MKRPPSLLAVLAEDEFTRDDWRPTASWENLRRRAELLAKVRAFFHENEFLEVETPILSADTVVDRHLDPFSTGAAREPGRPPRRLWLQTSPEFAMKRLLATLRPLCGAIENNEAGEAGARQDGSPPRAIYQITRAFRLGEYGPLHNPEFTMVEWYRAGDDMQAGMELTGRLCEAMLGRGPAEPLSYREAFERHVELDPHTADTEALIAAAHQHGVAAPASLAPDDRDGWLELLLCERVRPHLGLQRQTILYDYPASQSALARIRDGDPPVAERFELFVDGIELASGYHELLDADELRRRNREINAQRRADGKTALPERSRLLRAMEVGLPACTGVALGFDRLVMLAAGAERISEVTAFPFERA